MFEYFRGSLIETATGSCIIEVNGIGYRIFIPSRQEMASIGSEIKLFISFVIRENSQTLYGFFKKQERELFELLIGLTGIGPKTALGIISYFSLNELNQAIHEQNITALSKIPGIGKKTAERLIVELKDKLQTFSTVDVSSMQLKGFNRHSLDALNALINLGYNQQNAQSAVKKAIQDLSEEAELSQIITLALKNVRSK